MKFAIFVLTVIILSQLANHYRWGYDDTDNKRNGKFFGKRSGLTVYTDHLTGIQYVGSGLFGGITPRLDKEGKPITK